MANVQKETNFRFDRIVLVDEILGAEVGRADCIDELDFDALAGCEEWSVYGEFVDTQYCIVTVNQHGLHDRIGRIRCMVRDWLHRLQQEQRLCAVESGGGVDFPMLRVGED